MDPMTSPRHRGLWLLTSFTLAVGCAGEAPTHIATLDGPRTIVIRGGVSEPIAFDVPAESVSISISLTGPDDVVFGVGSWHQGGGPVLVPAGWLGERVRRHPEVCASCPNRVRLAPGRMAAVAPNNPGVTLVPGRHVVTLLALADVEAATPIDTEVSLVVQAKVGPRVPERGFIDLVFHVGGTRWSPDSIADDAAFERLLEGLRQTFEPAGLTLGEVTIRALSPKLDALRDPAGADSPLAGVLASEDHGGVDVVLVDRMFDLAGPDGRALRGYSYATPSGAPGGVRAVVVLAVEPRGAIDVPLAHEIGHALGLFHTSEVYAGQAAEQLHDQLPDTADEDSSLLMFVTRFGRGITPMQAEVLRRHPRVRHAR